MLERLRKRLKFSRPFYLFCAALALIGVFFIALPSMLLFEQSSWHMSSDGPHDPFPVTVDPKNKRIIEDPDVEALLGSQYVLTPAMLAGARSLVESIGAAIASAPWYQMLAGANAPRAVVIYPGFRKEQVAYEFGRVLGWDTAARGAFIDALASATSTLPDGVFATGTYILDPKTTPAYAASLVQTRFNDTILSRYPESTEEIVPLKDAITLASLLERETADPEEMRVISGIIWNRLFTDMKLQIDATLQYARGTDRNGWWPPVRTRDKYIDSPYNTYKHAGLPPGPIANPSVAAIVAALNPKSTDCLFYFHQNDGTFHCTQTYEEHVKLLRQFYGRGR